MKSLKQHGLYFAFFLNLLIIIGFWGMGSYRFFSTDPTDIMLVLGRLAGLLAAYFMLLQFVLMGRAVWIEKTFGLDKLARVHRLNGYVSILLIIIHPILLILSYAISSNIGIFTQLGDFLWNYEDLWKAALAVILFITIVFLSIYIVRKHLKYETWYYVHLLTYLAVLLAFGHQLELGGDFSNQLFVAYWYLLYIFVFGNTLIFRFLKPLYNYYKHGFSVSDVVRETADTTSIYMTGKNLESFQAQAGQFIIVRFLVKGFWWQAHPFSLSFLPKNNQIRLTIKHCGDFTSAIPTLKKGTRVLIDGPYGVFTASADPTTKFLFMAGGVGITPIRALIEKVAPTHDLILLYSNRDSQNIIFKNELEALSQKYHFPLHFIVSDEKNYAGEQGRIDQEKIKRLAKDVREREIYICGPPPMTEGLKNLLQTDSIGVKARQLHYEKFSL